MSRPSRVALCVTVLLLARSAAAATLTRGPYLQLLTPTSVTVVWRTDTAAACGLSLAPAGGSPALIPGASGTLCVVPLAGLTPGRQYGYVPLADGTPLAPETLFRTDDPAAPFTFIVMGDSGCGCADQMTVRDRLLATPADFILSAGDMIYKDGAAADFDPKFFVPYADLLRRLVFWPALGNHDIHSEGAAPWRDAFYTPANNPEGAEHYYSFDFGNAHVVVLDSNGVTSPGSAQYRFLERDLAASRATWKFVAFHHSVYTNGGHGSALTIRRNLGPVIDQQRVDIVFAGHSHGYERTFPMRGEQVVAPSDGTLYVTTGGGGASTTAVDPSPFTAYGERALHVTRVAVNGPSLLLEMVRADGTTGDTVALTKATPPPPGRCGDGIAQLGEQCDDGNLTSGDGCDASCTVTRCGNGIVTGSEQCDDGNAVACDGCSATCTRETSVTCLAPAADTFIAPGTRKTWNHGKAAFGEVDASPMNVAYLKFDLRAVTAPVRSAKLLLYWGNSSPDGGTLYPVASSDWIEGTGNGRDASSATASGLRWTDVDTNGNSQLDAQDVSPYLPDFTQPLATLGDVGVGETRTVDVTSAFQRGAGLYTLALRTGATDGGTFYSREHPMVDNRPRLVLQLTPPCNGDADCDDALFCNGAETCVAGGCRVGVRVDCNDGNACTIDRCDESTRACQHPGDTSRCDDGNPCTADTCDAAVGCRNTTAPCAPTVDLAAVADTHVENGTQATWDHGAADHLDVDLSPADVAYLKFDLTSIPAAVQRATLTLRCTNSAADGGTIYPVLDSSWIEGTETGTSATSAGGPGLKWNDVDTNRDGMLDARDVGAWVPDFGHPIVALGGVASGQDVVVDLTAMFQRGPGLYSLAIKNGATDGATYASRTAVTASQRPRLHLELGTPGGSTSTTTTTTVAASTTTTTTSAPSSTLDVVAGADTYIESGTEAAWDHGAASFVDVDLKPVDFAYLRFDLRAVQAPIARATLLLNCTNSAADGGTVYPVGNSAWIEGTGSGADASSAAGPGLKWNDVDTNRDGTLDTRDGSPWLPDFTRPAGTLRNVVSGQPTSVDVTSAFQRGAGLYTIAIGSASTDGASYSSRTTSTPSKRPTLRLALGSGPAPTTTTTTAGPATTTTTVAPSGTRDVAPTADTYIEAGTEATWDHGAGPHLDVDRSPFGIAYLGFDLRDVAGRVTQATLTLYCSNASVDGGTVYAVRDSSWIEGSGNGVDASSAGGPGLKWTNVDTNGDARVDAADTSPWVPDFSRPVATVGPVSSGEFTTVDVTSAFAGGPARYTLAIASGSSDGATFASRQNATAARRPRLHLVLAP